jgi:hypothetical protein
MKNLHLIPTDKPSRVYKHLGRELKYTSRNFEQKGLLCINQNIYITSDEEPKAGDWSLYQYKIHKCIEDIVGDEFKKIILTTDQDLINDGVQAIDDEFLEWFVQNPSCESVDLDTFSMGNKVLYNVVFPKEEPKQIKCYCGHTTYCDCGPLEEASWKYNPLKKLDGEFLRQAFKEGAKWQQEKMYSEEDMKLAYFSAIQSTGEGWNGEYAEGNNPNIEDKFSKEFKEWFEQFKKNGGDKC